MAQIPGSARVNQYTATASQTVFIYDYKIYDDDEIKVQQNDDTLTLTTDYTVQDAGEDSGGTITLVTGATLDDTITLTGNSMIERDAVFTAGGDYLASAINGEYNKLDDIAKEIVTDQTGNFRLAVYNDAVSKTIPSPSAGLTLKWNATATALENSTYDPDTQVASAAASAAAALVSEVNASDSEDAAAVSAAAALVSENAAAASAASVDFSAVATNILPATTNTYNLGNTAFRWKNMKANNISVSDSAAFAGFVYPTVTATTDLGLSANRWANVWAGNVTTSTINGLAVPTIQKHAMFTYVVAAGDDGGGYVTGSWAVRPINTEVYDTIGCNLDTILITIPAGTYHFSLSMIVMNVEQTQWLIRNDTASSDIIFGNGQSSFGNENTDVTGNGIFTVGVETQISVKMYGTRSQAVFGMGYGLEHTIAEKLLTLILTKVA